MAPALLGTLSLALLRPPDILVSKDGRHVGITGEAEAQLLMLRKTRSGYVSDNLTELAGMRGETRVLDDWPGARCSRDFCTLSLRRGERIRHLLMARSRERVPERALAAACRRSDIVIADRWLPRSCRPRWFKADRGLLQHTGGLAIDLRQAKVSTVAQGQGKHGWWQAGKREDRHHRRRSTGPKGNPAASGQ
jgi:competence protein ComEC